MHFALDFSDDWRLLGFQRFDSDVDEVLFTGNTVHYIKF